MTRFPHDDFAKNYLTELLSPLGEVQTEHPISSEIRYVDVWFIPRTSTIPHHLGLLGNLVNHSALFEPFRNPVTRQNIRSCINKLFTIQEGLLRDNRSLPENELPYLWILTPTASSAILEDCAALEENGTSGIYQLPFTLHTGIIVIHQLPVTPETLWLRILGRGRVQQQALEELQRMPSDHPHRENTLELVYNLLAQLEMRRAQDEPLETEEEELIMQLSPVYLQRLEEATQRGVEQGLERGLEQGLERGLEQGTQQERRATVESLLQTRFNSIDPQLRTIMDSIISLPSQEFIPLLLTLSREELLERFGA
ncbi:hypothetical protein K4A83_09860 [Spirulina subsalsa FACHB-351]|uniref:Flagellar assembly protein H n=1 Tax=Spirulina subsalsa FACHB-351 TaxID=234711 RepID=A0ABT3L637_9CYAN|nr:hypothetical protein [Spirulina subsalsa]MCW6036564.1 hypothetical protein [Spirulina subsalsa FACHB-351]